MGYLHIRYTNGTGVAYRWKDDMAQTRNNNKQDRDPRNTGFINMKLANGRWTLGGSFTDQNGEEFDLGYIVTSPHGLIEALGILAKQMAPTMNGKGIRKERRQ